MLFLSQKTSIATSPKEKTDLKGKEEVSPVQGNLTHRTVAAIENWNVALIYTFKIENKQR